MGREILCDHCERTLTSKAYHVISEDTAGGILLDMIVCQPCNQKAQELGLKTREFNLDDRLIEDHYLKGGK
jgi:pimeloyl-CoA synthetase